MGSPRLPKGGLAVGRDVFVSADCLGLFRSIASVAGCSLRIIRFGREAVLGQRDQISCCELGNSFPSCSPLAVSLHLSSGSVGFYR